MSNVTINEHLAKIAISKNLIKEYNTSESERTVYLKDGTEFQIYLKNPNQYHLGFKIYINDNPIGNTLVLKPGQSYWLDRFLDSNNKFLFSTYDVENTTEMKYATEKNGIVRIELYKENESYNIFSTIDNTTLTRSFSKEYIPDPINCYHSTSTNIVNSIGSTADTLCYSSANNSHTFETCSANNSHTFETGRIEKGSESNQQFETCDINLQYFPSSTEYIKILPSSRKQIRTEDIRRKYCSQCGKKVSPKDKFCSNCGTKL